jgi:hypothetical protein
MRQLITTLSILFLAFSSWQQTEVELLKTPKEKLKSIESLTNYLVKDQGNDSLKAVRIYKWITHNIAYDYKSLMTGKPLRYNSATQVLKSKRTICQGYSILMVRMLESAGILATTVEGYTSNYASDSIPYVNDGDHEWVAFRIEGKWYLCDPTWDAGYIGRKPKLIEDPLKLDKINKKREEKLKSSKSDKKKKRLERKYAKKDKAYEKKVEDNRGKYTGEIGFVRDPNLNFFMLLPDEFIQTHLPALPEFQLRKYPITMPDFYTKTKSWDTILERKSGNAIDYNDLCQIHAHRKLHDKWVATATGGLVFNPLSYGTMALNHYNYVGVNLSEDARKNYEIIQKQDLHESMFSLEKINDSVIVYTKLAQKIEKQGYAIQKRMVAAQSKEFMASHKGAKSTSVKVVKAQEKTIEQIGKMDEKAGKSIKLLLEKRAKLLTDNPSSSKQSSFDINQFPAEMNSWKDSLLHVLTTIDSLRKQWDKTLHGETLLNYRFELLKYSYENSFYNLINLNASATYYSDTVIHYDTLVNQSMLSLLEFHKEGYQAFYYPGEIAVQLKVLEKLTKRGLAMIKRFGDKNINFKTQEAKNYLQSTYYQTLSIVIDDLYQFRQDTRQLTAIEKDYNRYYKRLETNFKKEEEFKIKNIDYNKEVMEKNNERLIKMYELLLENSQKLKERFKKVNG